MPSQNSLTSKLDLCHICYTAAEILVEGSGCACKNCHSRLRRGPASFRACVQDVILAWQSGALLMISWKAVTMLRKTRGDNGSYIWAQLFFDISRWIRRAWLTARPGFELPSRSSVATATNLNSCSLSTYACDKYAKFEICMSSIGHTQSPFFPIKPSLVWWVHKDLAALPCFILMKLMFNFNLSKLQDRPPAREKSLEHVYLPCLRSWIYLKQGYNNLLTLTFFAAQAWDLSCLWLCNTSDEEDACCVSKNAAISSHLQSALQW